MGFTVLAFVIEATNSRRWGRDNFIAVLFNRTEIREDIKDCETRERAYRPY